MIYQVDHDLHIHSVLSPCCKVSDQTPERILQYAKDNGLHTICLTDHFWDQQVPGASNWYQPLDFDHICKAKPLPQDERIRFFFGCEVDMDADLNLGITRQRMDDFDFIIIATTHMHFPFTLKPEDRDSVEGRARAWVARLDKVLSMDLPFHKIGIAHLGCHLIYREENRFVQVLDAIPEAELVRLFTNAARVGVGIELNIGEMLHLSQGPEAILRPFKIAKACGCKFYLASDAHSPANLSIAPALMQQAIDLLELTEENKFRL